MFKRTGGGFTLLAILIACCLLVLKDFPGNVKTGIDLQGGTELVYGIDMSKVPASRRNTALEEVRIILNNRLDQYGIKELSVTPRGSDSLVIQIPSTDDKEVESIKDAIRRAGKLSIHLVDDALTGDPDRVKELEAKQEQYDRDWSRRQDQLARGEEPTIAEPVPPEYRVVPLEPDMNKMVIDVRDGGWVSGKDITSAYPTTDEYQRPAVGFEFNSAGAAAFAELTGNNINKPLAMVLDGIAKSRATINSRISTRGILTGNYTQEDVKTTVTLLRTGSLPADPTYDSESRIGALLGEESVRRGTQAMIIGFVLVLIFMVVYYRLGLGGIATISLLFNLVLVLTMLIIFRNSLTLPGMAGFLLTVGMSVDANILIFERIREERRRGRGLAQSVSTGYGKAFSTIFDANLTTLITAYILFNFGTGAVKGFAVVLSIGIITSFFTSLYVSRLLITFLVKRGLVNDFKMLQLVGEPKIPFLSYRKLARAFSITVLVIGLTALAWRGPSTLGIDFTGGTRLVVNLRTPVAEKSIRDRVHDLGGEFKDVQVQAIDSVDGQATTFSIRTRQETDATASAQEPPSADSKVGAPGGAGFGDAGEKIGVAEAFKKKVEETLRADGLLAPWAITDQDVNRAAETFTATVHLKDRKGGNVSPQDVKNVLEDAAYPVAAVDAAPTGSVGVWGAFVVRSEKSAEFETLPSELRSALNKAKTADLEFVLADPFPEVSTIGSRVAQDMQGKVFIAMVLAFAAIIFYISLRFQFKFGLAAIVALLHDIFFTLGALAVFDWLLGGFLNLKINLPVVAALLTVVGYSLNDTIVIFDRIRENLQGKKRDVDYEAIINTSINGTLSRTVLTSATTFVVVAILLFAGGEALHGFSFALCIGVLVGTYSSIYVASPALVYFHGRSEKRHEEMLEEAAAAKS